ncbi:MAG: hypothetical protein AB7G37_08735 [Solirubrobacteraceae bacterium]
MSRSAHALPGPFQLAASSADDAQASWPSSLALAAHTSVRSAALGTLGGMVVVAAVAGLGGLLG